MGYLCWSVRYPPSSAQQASREHCVEMCPYPQQRPDIASNWTSSRHLHRSDSPGTVTQSLSTSRLQPRVRHVPRFSILDFRCSFHVPRSSILDFQSPPPVPPCLAAASLAVSRLAPTLRCSITLITDSHPIRPRRVRYCGSGPLRVIDGHVE